MTLKRTKPLAFTLKELTIVMSISSFLMVTAVGLLSQSMRSVTTMRHLADDDRTFFRLSRQWRHDAHLAVTATQDGTDLLFNLRDDHSVKYSFDNESLVRVEQRDGNAEQRDGNAEQRDGNVEQRDGNVERRDGNVVRRETFRWRTPMSMSPLLLSSSNTAAIVVHRRLPQPADPQRSAWRQTRAVVGLRLRHENGGTR